MTATASATLLDKYTSIFGIDGFLNAHNVERREDIELLGLATISGVDTLFLGEPGVGKTWAIEGLVNYCIADARLFTHLFAKDQSPSEVLGPLDIMAMKNGQIARLIDGFLPSANYGYCDEIFKASPPMLNPMLDVLANRKLKVGGLELDLSHLITIFMSSNELPDREDLMAFRDRIGITKYVLPVRSPEGRRHVTDIQLDYQSNGLDTSSIEPLALDEIHAIRDEVRQVTVGEAVRQVMVDAQQKWAEAGHPPSQRRIGQMWKVIKARAWANGRSEVVTDDFLPAQHMAWNHPDHADSAREIILEFASVFTRKAQRLRGAMEPVIASMEELRSKLDSATEESEKDDLMSDGFKFMRQLRKMRGEAKEQIKDGSSQGQDTTLLEEVLSDIERSYAWAENALTGGEDD
jgi:MoxR-like ATPase